jgi:glycosyltransferase involved in cell wall biosynthesis
MRILFYTGYYRQAWGPNNLDDIGGTEIAVLNLAEKLVTFGMQVVVSGMITPGKWNGVEWLETESVHQLYPDGFDVIVGVSYLHFALEFSGYRARKVFWVHNTDYHPWYNGAEMVNSVNLLSPDYIDEFICLTNWHREQWSQKYQIDPGRIKVIGNAIDPLSFQTTGIQKVRNRFIWSSAPERGLTELLQQWPLIRQVKPDATLHVYTPGYQRAPVLDWKELNDIGVTLCGSVNQLELHRAMLRAQYWPYLTGYEETYCITALEMQFARVLPITTDIAALGEVVQSGIILSNDETKWNLAIQSLSQLSASLESKALTTNFNFAKQQSWLMRALEWYNLFTNED